MLAQKNTYIHHAYQQLQVISQDKEKRLEYEAREKALLDHNQLMLEAEQRRIEIGKQLETERINKLNLLLIENNRYDDLKRSVNDANFQQQLLSDYGI